MKLYNLFAVASRSCRDTTAPCLPAGRQAPGRPSPWRLEVTVSWENDPTSGIIPRTSFLELQNAEIFGLLSAQDDTTKLRLFEDSTKKGNYPKREDLREH